MPHSFLEKLTARSKGSKVICRMETGVFLSVLCGATTPLTESVACPRGPGPAQETEVSSYSGVSTKSFLRPGQRPGHEEKTPTE